MIAASETDLICDLAETYGVFDYKALPLGTVAALSSGLRDDSRIKLRLTGQKIGVRDMILAGIFDRVELLVWMQTKDGQKNRNRPEPMLARLMGQTKHDDVETFESLEEFEAARWRIIGG